MLKSIFGSGANDDDIFDESLSQFMDAITVLNIKLDGKNYLLNNKLSVADVIIAIRLFPIYNLVLDDDFRKAMANVTGWLERFLKLPEVD